MNNAFDTTQRLACGSLIQHGKYNDRIYLMKLSNDFQANLPQMLIKMGKENNYSKVFAKIPARHVEPFSEDGYVIEAAVPDLFNAEKDDGLFISFFLDPERTKENDAHIYAKNIEIAQNKNNSIISEMDIKRFSIHPCNDDDIEEMVRIYEKVFLSYPFPIHEDEYIRETMNDNVDYFCVETEGKIVALSSAEKDVKASNVEMTDFATIPEWRGKSLSTHLLMRMEVEMKRQGIKTAYTIARAASAGMNITFSKMGYIFAGRLANNTNISGSIESMNVWYKGL